MISRSAMLPPAEVEALLYASPLPDSGGWKIVQRLPSHRRDPSQRQQFIVGTKKDRAFLTVGPDLADLILRTKAFTETYPTLAPRLLGVAVSGNYSLILQEYVTGNALLTAFPNEAGTIVSALVKLQETFTSTLSPSSVRAASIELKQLEDDVLALDLWRDADRRFLSSHVFPFLATRLIPTAPKIRMSNGDFISRNLLARVTGGICVIDYENAGFTHFYGEDWFRFGYWDEPSIEVRRFIESQIGDRVPWTVYFALRQLVLESRQNRRRPFLVDAHRWCREIRTALRNDPPFSNQTPVWPPEVLTPVFTAGVQVFWKTLEQDWSEEASLTSEVGVGEHTLVFSLPPQLEIQGLRLDPLDLPGIACIRSVTIHASEKTAPLLRLTGGGLLALTPAGDAVIKPLPNEGGLKVESAGNDPQLYLPPVPLHPGGLKITVVLSIAPL